MVEKAKSVVSAWSSYLEPKIEEDLVQRVASELFDLVQNIQVHQPYVPTEKIDSHANEQEARFFIFFCYFNLIFIPIE